ncbi:hypothetical protein EVB94_339 [Rhizobium phage RHph_TM40]|uniref:Uncharacterized protein n=2 Tax=Cuauhnahuacvirus TaxID=3044696 RepID=A0A7S5UXV0_9CAUD|nr:hypothetical protein PQC16_gp322 [Rhizobium phage RHph_TM30]YP_010671467.1 hypothetical protein PQC17_gp323 [Rhizobium phage RHph_Y65]QIG71790.1 hypothetical protein EVB94_339 [Rhizobium phage RHph_TM40]QIG72151.1 hypothetical protein EVB95_337 [Rhizobium phage RHph_TM2_3B]QIG72513.1 hypothetical protein EVB96_337 [Rhizobium phage RHph_TM3_3_6]QIG77903.1 hypothetical protein EVB64_337 [Rhizobium phage RHph_TM61]QIG71426.1 hypothetical protein EVB93_339 [Rhizobium phage RHph_TM30]
MPYDIEKDPSGWYSDRESNLYNLGEKRRTHQSTKSYLLTSEMIGNKELPIYGKALDIYVPSGIVAEITVVPISNEDSEPQTYKRPQGAWILPKFVRRIVSVVGTGVEIHVEHD